MAIAADQTGRNMARNYRGARKRRVQTSKWWFVRRRQAMDRNRKIWLPERIENKGRTDNLSCTMPCRQGGSIPMLGVMRTFALIVFCCCLLCACSKPKATDIPGIYSVRRSYGTERLHLRTDGSYEQVFSSVTLSRTNVGKWTFHPELRFVALDDALLFDDGWGKQASLVETSTWALNVRGRPGSVSLLFGESEPFYRSTTK